VLTLATASTCDLELDGRRLELYPAALADRITIGSLTTDPLVLRFPVAGPAMVRDPERRTPDPTLAALLGASRAAVLATIVAAPSVTTGRLATDLGISAAAASRHAGVLREAGLVTTVRDGMTVHHHPTRLGSELASGTGGQSCEPSVQEETKYPTP
jgi:DNA-binding transcriptional ArsR family regulator